MKRRCPPESWPSIETKACNRRIRFDHIFLVVVFLAITFSVWWVHGRLWGIDTDNVTVRGAELVRWLVAVILALLGVRFVWNLGLWMKYKPWPLTSGVPVPSVSVIIPVYNEGKGILDTIASIVNCDYPQAKLNIIIVNDGSSDDTEYWIDTAVDRYPNRLHAIHHDKNRGKREALATGMNQVISPIVITIDSDCIVAPDTIRQLVTPLTKHATIGSVAGHVRVRDADSNLFTRMLSASFAVAFDWARAAQSIGGAVLCSPGAITAYRMVAIRQIQGKWRNQHLWGHKCRIAEDRALTTLLLYHGWQTVYQSSAVIWTKVPASLRELWKMYLRWTRGDIRESLHYGINMLSGSRNRIGWIGNVNYAFSILELVAPYPIIAWFILSLSLSPFGILPLLSGIILGSSLVMMWYAWHERTWNCLYGILYGIFWILLCSWIIPWSLVTLWSDNWSTRHHQICLKPHQDFARPHGSQALQSLPSNVPM